MNDTALTLNERTCREIKAELGRQRLTQSDLAGKLGWSRQALSNRLTGKVQITLGDLEAIAWALEIPAQQLIRDHVTI